MLYGKLYKSKKKLPLLNCNNRYKLIVAWNSFGKSGFAAFMLEILN